MSIQQSPQICRASVQWLSSAVDLYALCFHEPREIAENFLKNESVLSNTMLAMAEGRVVAMAVGLPVLWHPGGHHAPAHGRYLYGVCVHPDHRHQGYMTKLLQAWVVLSKQEGLAFLCLLPANKSLAKGYEKLGFCHAMTRYEAVFQLDNTADKCLFEEAPLQNCKNQAWQDAWQYQLKKQGGIGFLPALDPVLAQWLCDWQGGFVTLANGLAVYSIEETAAGSLLYWRASVGADLPQDALHLALQKGCTQVRVAHKQNFAGAKQINWGMAMALPAAPLFVQAAINGHTSGYFATTLD